MATPTDSHPGILFLRARVHAGPDRPDTAAAIALVRRVVGLAAVASRRSADELIADGPDDERGIDSLELAAVESADGCDVDVRISGAAATAVATRLGELGAILEFAARTVRRNGIGPTLDVITAWAAEGRTDAVEVANDRASALEPGAPAARTLVDGTSLALVDAAPGTVADPASASERGTLASGVAAVPAWAASALDRARSSTAALIADAGRARLRFTVTGWQRSAPVG